LNKTYVFWWSFNSNWNGSL